MELIINNNTNKELIANISIDLDKQILREGGNSTADRLDFKNIKYVTINILKSD